MAKAVATSKGYMHGRIIESGEEFAIDAKPGDKAWPKWAAPADAAAKPDAKPAEPFGGKGDHDGDGKPGGSPAGDTATAKRGRKSKPETVDAPDIEPFAEAPAPQEAAGNGLQDALGGVEPDWVAPGSAEPQPVDD